MKLFTRLALAAVLLGTGVLPTQAGFSSLYVFGDALSATVDNPAPQPAQYYYGKRDCNGRVWVEVMAQRQGLPFVTANNKSYYDHNSSILVTDVKNFVAPPDVATALFIVWVCNSDTFDAASKPDNSSQWIADNKRSQTNHFQIITNLYAKGVRTLLMPNAVDISTIPAFNAGSFVASERAGCIDYNTRFSNAVSQAKALCPGLKVYTPDFYSLLNNVLTNAGSYGLTNMLYNGLSMDAVELHGYNASYPVAAINGFGTNFIFWDYMNPTAKFHAVIADVAQQLMSPAQITQLTKFNGSNRLDVVNMPVGLNGFVETGTNILQDWTSIQSFASINPTQPIFVTDTNTPPASQGSQGSQNFSNGFPPGNSPIISMHFYRLRFPYAWSWP